MEDGNKQIEKQLADLTNVDRLISNTLNLISDIEIKGAYAGPVKEIQDWLTGFKGNIATQISALKAVLPAPVASTSDEKVAS